MTDDEVHVTSAGMFCGLLHTRSWRIAILAVAVLPMFACNRYRARRELQINDYYAQIVQRVDRRWIGNDSFFADNLLANPYPEVRCWCAIALGRIASPRALPLLYKAIDSGDASVRAAAAFALGRILDHGFPQETAFSSDQQAIPLLRSLLDDPSISVQMRAVEALGKIGAHEEAVEIVRRLERVSHDGYRSPAERAYIGFAITALARLRDPAGKSVLERLAQEGDHALRLRASEALVRLQDRASFPPLLGHPDAPKPDPLRSLRKFGLSTIVADPGPVESSVSAFVSRALAASRKTNSIAIVETTRGTLEIELFREDAPVMVANFVLTAKKGDFNFGKREDWLEGKCGFVFKQVMPSQLIGGDIVGSQEGFGWALNGEINMRPFERGSVGISVGYERPENRRLFITLAPQPFLDGVDTCIGRVICGMPVADRIVSGDKILRVAIKETVPLLDRIHY